MFVSGVVATVIDSVCFLSLAGIALGTALPGLLLAKVWIQFIAIPLTGWLRRTLPVAAPA